jgi:hypothetical protein
VKRLSYGVLTAVSQKLLPYSRSRKISLSLGLCLAARPMRGSVSKTRAGLGWPTLARAFALTALVAEKIPGFFFFMTRSSVQYTARARNFWGVSHATEKIAPALARLEF